MELITAAERYFSPDAPEIKSLMLDAKDSIKASPAEAYSAMACVFQLSGDLENAVYHIDNAIKLAAGTPCIWPTRR